MTGVILMYHRVAAAEQDAYDISVAPERFAAHIDYLGRLGNVVPLTDILRPAKALQIAITLDDGYADNATRAAPVLSNAGLPATFFITTGRIGGQHFWWDRLAAGLLADYPELTGLDVSVGGRQAWLDLHDDAARRTSVAFLHQRLQPLPPDELLDTLDELLVSLNAPPPPDDAFTMTQQQLLSLRDLPLVEIGAHTRTHLQLGGQTLSQQQQEIEGSMADLVRVLGQTISSFAYPFGDSVAVGELAPRLAHEAGYAMACSTTHASVKRRPNPYLLPRLNVRDWEVPQLAAAIDEISRV